MVLERGVEWGHIGRNPGRHMRRPPAGRVRTVRPLAPAAVEAIRGRLGQRDATLVSVLAYAGLRPGEALALTWGHVGERTLLVEGAVADGVVKTTKTGQTRSVRLVAPLAGDLREWRMACGRPADDALVFPAKGGGPWADHAWRNWRRRVFGPAATAAKLDPAPRPYDLRHSFVSLLIREGVSIVEVAEQAGHSPQMSLATYAHVMRELEGGERRTAEEEINRARVPVSYPAAAGGERA
jgi:integrase